MSRFIINVTSECVSLNGYPYNSDRFEGSNELNANSTRAAIETEMKAYPSGSVTWYDDASAMVELELEDGNKKHLFFDAAEL